MFPINFAISFDDNWEARILLCVMYHILMNNKYKHCSRVAVEIICYSIQLTMSEYM